MRQTIVMMIATLALAGLSGCDAMVDGSNSRASVTARAFNDAKDTWTDLFTYHPKEPPNAPQTRYCYQMSSDIVCYDSVQPGLTARLFGYQDGNHMSWIQPGGGSLGASGGDPVAYKAMASANKPAAAVDQTNVIKVKRPLEYTPVEVPIANQGEIQTMNLPAK